MNSSLIRCTTRPSTRRVLVTAILSAALLFSGCSSVQNVSPTAFVDLRVTVHVGDRVDCTLHDGSHQRFEVTAVAPDALSGGTLPVAAADIATLKITRFDAVKTTELTVLIVAGLGGLAYAVGESVRHISFNYPAK